MSGPPPPLRLLIELVPPAIYTGTNQEQEFTIPIHPAQLQRFPDGRLAVGAIVSLNNVRTAQVDTSLQPMALNKKGKQIAALASTVLVPVVLHHEEFAFRITAIDVATNKKPWQVIIPYQLPADQFPRAAMASTWTCLPPQPTAPNGASVFAKCNISAAQLYAETFEFTGAELPVRIGVRIPDGGPLTLQLELQHVRNAASKEPMSFFRDRVWALRKFAIIADAQMFQA